MVERMHHAKRKLINHFQTIDRKSPWNLVKELKTDRIEDGIDENRSQNTPLYAAG